MLAGQGEDWMFRIDVGQAFTVAAGEPVAQFHAVLSTNATDVALGDPIVIGSVMPALFNVGTLLVNGFIAAQLTVGKRFFLRVNPWTAGMGRGFGGGTIIGKDRRYLGVLVSNPMGDAGELNKFGAGAIAVRMVKSSDVIQDPSDFIYPAATVTVG
jgi:hypothetical protein